LYEDVVNSEVSKKTGSAVGVGAEELLLASVGFGLFVSLIVVTGFGGFCSGVIARSNVSFDGA
jgi:hypothetical protein